MSTIEQLIKRDKARIFRKCEIKRRNPSTGYEATWLDVTSYVKKWGTVKYDMEDENVNTFKLSGINMVMRNDEGVFSPRTAGNSLFKEYRSAYKTKFRVRAGYYDDDESEMPASNTVFIGVMTDEIELNAKNEAVFKVKNLNSVFEDIPATKLAVTGSQTASDIVTKMKNLTDGASNLIFQEYISSTAWDIQTTTTIYTNLNTSTALNMSCWKLLLNLATSENFGVWVDNEGVFHFKQKTVNTSTSQFTFSGVGVSSPQYGHSIISIDSFKEAFSKVYTRVRVKYLEADTETSYYTKEEAWTVGDSTASYSYGQRTYTFENLWLDATGAATIGDALFNNLSSLKNEVRLTTKFITHLSPLDKVTVNYSSAETAPQDALWNHFFWNRDRWQGGNSIFSIISDFSLRGMEIDLDGLRTKFFLRGL